ncbi:hypothetical protein M5K25_008700 [Dendrobium thyrsiflorum]|uniref:Uncharacterized protein n=1 Tax=Dendrobium thyrsiflorum TaxID=117978 RepID=A0ABD0VG77_DENTH
MAESSRRVAPGEDLDHEALWAEHTKLARQTKELSGDFLRFFAEMHRELRIINARLDRQLGTQPPLPMNGPTIEEGYRRNGNNNEIHC